MIAVGAQYSSLISGNTIGSENGVHGRFGLLINNSSDVVIEDNRIGGLERMMPIGTIHRLKIIRKQEELDAEDKYMNVRVASGQLTQENQNYPQYLSQNSYGGNGYGVDRQVIDMQGNYWDNVNSGICQTSYMTIMTGVISLEILTLVMPSPKPSSDNAIAPLK